MTDGRRLALLATTLRYPPYVAGGYELLTRDAVEGLRARGHAATVLAGRGRRLEGEPGVLPWLLPALEDPDGRERDLFRRSFDASNAERFRLHVLRGANRRATLRALDRARPDLLLAFNLSHVSLAPLLAARQAGVPTLAYAADPWPCNHWLVAWRERLGDAPPPLRLRALEGLWRAVRETVGVGPLLAVSGSLRARLVACGLAPDEVSVLHLGVPPEMERSAEGAEPAPRAPGEPLRVACTSMLWEGKGQAPLLEAAARARGRGARVELVLAGDGEPSHVRSLRDRAEREDLEGAVTFAGRLGREEVGRLLRRAHVLALPSLWPEPFGLAGLEALAHATCLLTSDAGGSPEQVEHRASGLVAPAGDVAAWADALCELEADDGLRVALARAGRDRARDEFSHARWLDGLEAAARAAAERGA